MSNEQTTNENENTQQGFDARAKEAALVAEAGSWDTANVCVAQAGDIPVLDLTGIEPGASVPEATIATLDQACREVGFYYLLGHQMSQADIAHACRLSRLFHDLPVERKMALQMDQPSARVPGAGYLSVGHRKLPRRHHGNDNEAFIVKRDIDVDLDDNLWPDDDQLPGFRSSITALAERYESVAVSLLPLYAQALGVDKQFFAPAFQDPLYRLRLTHYPPRAQKSERFGIAPHVDTTFFTLLAQDGPGLHVYSERRDCWISVPPIEGALIVNTGELLKQWTNDEYISVKHFAQNNESRSRYSVPFFFNATSNYPMQCIPTCCSDERPAKYPPISYRQSQGVLQGE